MTGLVVQAICILALIGLGTMLILVSAYFTGALCAIAGAAWFVVLYRRSDND